MIENVSLAERQGGDKESLNNELLQAIWAKDSERLKVALEQGADPNCSVTGWSPLSAILSQVGGGFDAKEKDMLRILVESGADIDKANTRGETPLLVAVQHSAAKKVRVLLRMGAKVDQVDADGRSALHRSVREGNLSITASLLSANADPNLPDKLGRTPLHEGCLYCKEPILVKLLMETGADPWIEDSNGETPLDMSDMKPQGPIKTSIQEFMAPYVLKGTASIKGKLLRKAEAGGPSGMKP